MMPRRWANCRPVGHLQRDVQYNTGVQRLAGPDAPRQAAALEIGHDKIRALPRGRDTSSTGTTFGMLELLQMARLP